MHRNMKQVVTTKESNLNRFAILVLCGIWGVFLATANEVSAQNDSAKSAHKFSIQQCVEYAREHSTEVKNALLNVKIQEQENRGITAMALPNISASGNIMHFPSIATTMLPAKIFDPNAGENDFAAVKFGVPYTSEIGVSLQQILFDGQVFVGLQARKASIDLQNKIVDVTDEAIKGNIYKVYYQLAVSKTQIDLIDANISKVEKLLHDVTILNQNGFVEKLDVDKTSVQLANLKTVKQKTQNQISNGYLALKYLIGMPAKDELILSDSVTDEQIKERSLAYEYNYNDVKSFQLLEITKKLNDYNIKRYKYSKMPTLALVGSYNTSAQRTEFDIFKQRKWYPSSYVGINLSVPIFSGFAINANIKKAQLQAQQTENSVNNMKMVIDNAVAIAQNNFSNAIATLDFQKKNMQLAKDVYSQTKKKYDSGLSNNTEINSTQTDLITAETNYINAMYDAVISKIDYLISIGKL